METDYENYTLVSSCVGTPKNHVEWVYFLTREREWPDQNKELVSTLAVTSIQISVLYIKNPI